MLEKTAWSPAQRHWHHIAITYDEKNQGSFIMWMADATNVSAAALPGKMQ